MKEFTNTWTYVKKGRKTPSALDDHFGLTARYVRDQNELSTKKHCNQASFEMYSKLQEEKPNHCHYFTAINKSFVLENVISLLTTWKQASP